LDTKWNGTGSDPGGEVEVSVDTRLCVAETVIVGKVPDTYLQMGQ
jgi:hypothetical protein